MKQKLLQIIREAGDLIVHAREYGIEQKEGHANFVTSVDEEVERFLQTRLLALLPESCIIGEEQTNEPLGDGLTWIIDPIDGTTNFIHGYRFSSISVALLKDRTPIVGAIYQPYTDEMFYAEKGKGAELNGHPMHVTSHDLPNALVGFGTAPYNVELAQKSLEVALRFLYESADLRRSGSAALDLAYVAAGRQDVFFELLLKPWDYAAGALLVQEAGGVFTMPFLDEPDYGKITAILATNQPCQKPAEDLFRSFFH